MALNLGELFGTIGLDASEWDRKLEGAQGSLKSFGVAGAAVAATAAVAIGAALAKGIVDSIDIEAGTDKVQAQLGLTEAQAGVAGKAAGSLYAANYGESMEDVNGAVASVMSSIKGMRDASDADVEAMTAKMMNLSSVMEVDVARAAQVAGQMITSGIATDGAHAADLLTASLQKVPAAVREDILDAVDEYGPFMNTLGIKGEEAMGILVTASEKGMYGIDKTGDALKEFTIRATDMSAATRTAYEELGLSTDDMTGKLLAGGDQAKDAFGQIVAGLQEMEDPAAQSAAALALFGTPLEDLSVSEIPNFLGAIDPMGDKFDSVAGAADKMGQDLTSNAKSGFDGFVRQADAALIQFVQANIMPSVSKFATFLNTEVGPAIGKVGDWIQNTALPALRGFGDWFTANLPVITNWATGIGFLLIPLFLRIAISAGVSAAAQVVAWATAGAGAISAAAIYVAQSYVMIGRWVALAAAGTVNAIKMAAAWVVGVIGPAVTAAITMGVQAALVVAGWALMAAQSTINAVKMAASWVVGVAVPAAANAITMGVQAAIVVAGWVLMAVGAMANAVIMAAAWFVALGPVGWVIAAVIGLVALVIANWESVSKFTAEAWSNVTRFISEAARNVVKFTTDMGRNVLSFLSSTWSSALSGVSGFVGNAVGFFRDLPGKIIGALGNAGTILLQTGKNIVQGLIDGISGMMGAIGRAIINIVPEAIRGPFEQLLGIHSPSRVFRDYGMNIGQGLIDGVGSMYGDIESAVNGMVTVPDTVAPSLGTGGMNASSAEPATAAATPRGGLHVEHLEINHQRDPGATFMEFSRRMASLAS